MSFGTWLLWYFLKGDYLLLHTHIMCMHRVHASRTGFWLVSLFGLLCVLCVGFSRVHQNDICKSVCMNALTLANYQTCELSTHPGVRGKQRRRHAEKLTNSRVEKKWKGTKKNLRRAHVYKTRIANNSGWLRPNEKPTRWELNIFFVSLFTSYYTYNFFKHSTTAEREKNKQQAVKITGALLL